jgi:HSP20 family protein
MTANDKNTETLASGRRPDEMLRGAEDMTAVTAPAGSRYPVYFPDWIPSADMYEAPDSITAWVDLPGVEKKDITIEVGPAGLVVYGERRTPPPGDKDLRRLNERGKGRFRRTLTLYSQVRADEVRASFENGVLKVEIPKLYQTPPRKITLS